MSDTLMFTGHVQSPIEYYLTGNRKEYFIRQTHLLLLWVFLGKSNSLIPNTAETNNELHFSRSDFLHVNIQTRTQDLHEKAAIFPQSHPQPPSEEHCHLQDTDLRDIPAGHALHAVPAFP